MRKKESLAKTNRIGYNQREEICGLRARVGNGLKQDVMGVAYDNVTMDEALARARELLWTLMLMVIMQDDLKQRTYGIKGGTKMKNRIIIACIALWTVFLFYGCAAGAENQNENSVSEISIPSLSESVQGDSIAQEPKAVDGDTIPQLEDAAAFEEMLSHEDTMKLWVMEYYASYTVEDERNERFVVNKAVMEENSLGAEIADVAMDEICTTIYRVPFRERYLLSYDSPRESCYVKASWIQNSLFASVEGSGIQTVEFSLSGVRITGENMEYTIKYFLDNEDHAILKVAGKGENAVCLSRTEDGFRFYCRNGAVMELPDFYEMKAVKSLDIPTGMVGAIDGISRGYVAELYLEEYPE